MNYKCFLLEHTDQVRVSLRRYTTKGGECPDVNNHGYHNAAVVIGVETESEATKSITSNGPVPHDDHRWPTRCTCGFAFSDEVEYCYFPQALWKRADTGELITLSKAPIGAVWDAYWNHDRPQQCGLDGKCMYARTPGGDWHIDGRCSNCTLPDDKVHRCWVRHGSDGDMHVDKNGVTCQAGGGSILQKNYHGFLNHGYLNEC
jgi:hypothetical protein